MPNLNDENVVPVSFRKGGFTHGGQVHIEGTFAYLPKEIAEWDEDEQVLQLGDVYWSPGIRRGFTPASETYLAGEYQRRLESDRAAASPRQSVTARATAGVDDEEPGTQRVITGGPVGDVVPVEDASEFLPGGVIKATGETPQGYTLQNPQGLQHADSGHDLIRSEDPESSHVAEGGTHDEAQVLPGSDPSTGEAPQGYELTPATTDTALNTQEKANADAHREALAAEPFPNASKATIEQTRTALADADDEQIAAFLAWEKARTDREPRRTLINELEGGS